MSMIGALLAFLPAIAAKASRDTAEDPGGLLRLTVKNRQKQLDELRRQRDEASFIAKTLAAELQRLRRERNEARAEAEAAHEERHALQIALAEARRSNLEALRFQQAPPALLQQQHAAMHVGSGPTSLDTYQNAYPHGLAAMPFPPMPSPIRRCVPGRSAALRGQGPLGVD